MKEDKLRPKRRSYWHSAGLLVSVVVLGATFTVGAAEYYATPLTYRTLLAKLSPGDTLELAPGEYVHGLPLHRMNGEPGRPIVIAGSPQGEAVKFLARRGANTVSIIDSSHVTVRGLVLDGQGLPVHAVVAEGRGAWAHHISLEKLRIVNHDAGQQVVGISTKCPAWGWVIRDNAIIGAGTGMYLGNSDGSAPFIGGIIEHNVIVDSIGYNLQIKHQNERPRTAGMPEEKSVTVIRYNIFSKSANSSRGKIARPNLLVGHWPQSGPGTEDTYAIYGNFFFENPSEALFQGEGNLAFYSNILVNTLGDAINIQPHNAVPRRIDVFHNTVLAANTGIRVSGADPAYSQRVIANAVFANAPIIGGAQHANKTGPLAEAADNLNAPFAPLGRLDLAPQPGKLLTAPFSLLPQAPIPDLHQDFEGRPYPDPLAGAYASDKTTRRLTININR